jgi:hypothetical protein
VSAYPTPRRQPLRISVVLLAALLPMLTFFGHWDELGITPHSHAAHEHDERTTHASPGQPHHHHAEHASHCHVDLASCADVPLTALTGFALLNDSLAVLGEAGVLIPVNSRPEQRPRANVVRPAVPPPRA